MNNTIYIANDNDNFSIDIPSFDVGATSTGYVESQHQYDSEVSSNKTLTSFSVMAICIVVFVIFVLLLRKRNVQQEEYEPIVSGKIERREKVENKSQEQNNDVEERSETALYRHNSKRRSSLSTPSSINKCIKAFLENTKEN